MVCAGGVDDCAGRGGVVGWAFEGWVWVVAGVGWAGCWAKEGRHREAARVVRRDARRDESMRPPVEGYIVCDEVRIIARQWLGLGAIQDGCVGFAYNAATDFASRYGPCVKTPGWAT